MRKNRPISSFVIFNLIFAFVPYHLYPQLQPQGFPFAIGNKWFYEFESVYFDATQDPPFVHVHQNVVKEIVDAVTDGFIIHQYRRDPYSLISQEKWTVIDGKFSNSAISYATLYDASIKTDQSWTVSGSGNEVTVNFISTNRQAMNFGLTSSVQCIGQIQFRSTYYVYDSIYTALGIGIYLQRIGPASGIYTLSHLTGILINSQFYGDSVGVTAIKNGLNSLPMSIKLNQNFPNPFNPTTTISFVLPSSKSDISLKVYDMLGREVAVLFEGRIGSGEHSYRWDATGYPSGMYIYRLYAGNFFDSKKLVLLK